MENFVDSYEAENEKRRRRFIEQSELLAEIKAQFELRNEERERLMKEIKANLEIISEQNLRQHRTKPA